MQNLIIPDAIQITMDDLGWFCGTDGREKMEPARTGITRRHCAEDYAVVNEIGSRLGMRINCAMVMGEWDSDNRLNNIPALSPYGENWDNAACFDEKEAKRCADVINSSEYIDLALHGLYHTYYRGGERYNNTDYYFVENNELCCVPDDEIRMRLDAFFDLVEYHGIKKEINSFIPPNFDYLPGHLPRILKDYGIRYISTEFTKIDDERFTNGVAIDDGITVVDRKNNYITWNRMECKLDGLPMAGGVFGCHWANVCHKDPLLNFTLVDSWVKYFEDCKNVFGIILSRGMPFCTTQSVYKKYSRITSVNGGYTIDLTAVPQNDSIGSSFYISCKNALRGWSDCDVELYEKLNGFINYKVTPSGNKITLMCDML